MGYVLEANKTLISSAYWDGLNMEDLRAFTGAAEHLHLTDAEHLTAGKALGKGLIDVIEGRTKETLLSTGDFDPDGEKMPDGTIVILDAEYLIKWDRDRDRLDVEGGLYDRGVEWHHIIQPVTNLWSQLQQVEEPDGLRVHLGEEHAGFSEQKAFYYRALRWGVYLRRAEDGRGVLDTWPFTDPTIGRDFGIHVSVGRNQITVPTPLAIGEVVPDPPFRKRLSPRSVHRIIDVTAIESQGAMHQFALAQTAGEQA